MQYVYIPQSLKYPDKYYVGCTSDVAERLERHNGLAAIPDIQDVPAPMRQGYRPTYVRWLTDAAGSAG